MVRRAHCAGHGPLWRCSDRTIIGRSPGHRRLAIAGVLAVFASQASAQGAGTAQPPAPSLAEIVEMRSIDSLILSPDGRTLAYRVLIPSLQTNKVMAQWFAVPVAGDAPPGRLGGLAEPVRMPMFDTIEDGAAKWNPDSRALYVRQIAGSAIGVHRLKAGGVDELVTPNDTDVLSFALSGDGRQLTYRVHDKRAAIEAAQAREESEGIHFDHGVSAEGIRLTRNSRVGDRETTVRYVSLGAAKESFAGAEQERSLTLAGAPDAIGLPRPVADISESDQVASASLAKDIGRALRFSASGIVVRLEQVQPAKPYLYTATVRLVAMMRDGSMRPCTSPICTGLTSSLRQVALNDATGEVVILSEKNFSGRTAVYGWNPLTDKIRLIRAAESSLDGGSSYSAAGCAKARNDLLCVDAGPIAPPRLVRLDMTSGALTTLAAPNAALAGRSYGPTRFLEWIDADGNPSNGVLVLPRQFKGALPLVITSYRCRGFLRGGMAALAPEHVLAQRGFAALCVNNNNAFGTGVGTPTLAAHKGAIAAYRAIIGQLAHEGLIDSHRVGLGGHSFTSMVAAYAIANTDLFAAAVIGTGITIDPATFMFTEPTPDSWRKGILDYLQMPNPFLDKTGEWQAISPALNATKIRAPLLIQPPENEYLLALQLFAGMKAAGTPVDMYIYPNEGHLVTREPSHQLWRNRRSIDWFDFWLNGRAQPDADTRSQFDAWTALRNARPAAVAN